jgi:hypothetical protein
MQARYLVLGLIAVAGCGSTESDADGDEANRVARAYLDAAAERDYARLCSLRTEGSVARWGGRDGCERRAVGLVLGPYRHVTPQTLRARLERKGAAVDAATAAVLPEDTEVTDGEARVVVDAGRALVEDGHAVGDEVIEIDLKRERERWRVARVGFASFAD